MEKTLVELRKRFVSDNNLPIQILNNDLFDYYLDLYEDIYQSKTKYANLLSVINEKFEGKESLFLNEYYKVRNIVITDILNNEYFNEFNTSAMGKFAITNDIPTSSIYKEDNHERKFLSIDIKKANFSALKYINTKIFDIDLRDTYEDFMSKYTDIDYIKNSKYTRQVIFGQLNPSRQITVQKYIINNIHKFIMNMYPKLKPVSFCSDEIVYDITELDVSYYPSYKNNQGNNELNMLEIIINNNFAINIKCDIFVLKKHLFYSQPDNNKLCVYEKYRETNKHIIPVCCPSFYFAQVYKSLNKLKVNVKDLHFIHENQLARFTKKLNYKK